MLSTKKKNEVVKVFIDSLYKMAKVNFADTSYKPVMDMPLPK
jgi:hypothetical protein